MRDQIEKIYEMVKKDRKLKQLIDSYVIVIKCMFSFRDTDINVYTECDNARSNAHKKILEYLETERDSDLDVSLQIYIDNVFKLYE